MYTERAPLRPRLGKTLRVWEIADQLTHQQGSLAKRQDVIHRVEAEGGNPNTASTQYSHWKKAYEQSVGTELSVERDINPLRLVVGPDGRLLIPVDMRRAMKLDNSGVVVVQVTEGELRVVAPSVAIERAQALVREFDKGTGSVVDELISDRRDEAQREAQY